MRLGYRIMLITLFAFTVRIFTLLLLGYHIRPELWEYDKIALNLIQNKGYSIEHLGTIHRSYIYPVYPAISAFFRLISRDNYFIFIEVFQILSSSLVCYFIFLIAKRIYDEKTGLFSSFIVAVHPGLIVYSAKVHELTLVSLFMVIIFYFIVYLDWSRAYNNLIIGALIGLGTLTRPTIILFLAVYAFYLWLRPSKKINIFKAMAIVFLSVVLLILPWTIRNYKIHKRWVFITTTSAQQFWMGNNPGATGSGLAQDGQSVLSHAPQDFFQKLYKMNEIEQSDFFRQQAFSFIKSKPGQFLNLLFKKFFYFWWFTPQTGKLYPLLWTIIYKIYYGLLFILFIFGLLRSFRKLKSENVAAVTAMLILFFLVSFLHSIYYVEMRHRWAIESLMCITCAYGFINILEEYKKFRTLKLL